MMVYRTKFIFAAILIAAFLAIVPNVRASTHSPCTGHSASTPYVVGAGPAQVGGGGSIYGCPAVTTVASESVTITVCLQRFNVLMGTWVDKNCNGPSTKSWNKYYRYARSNGLSVYAPCQAGDWRTDVRGGDGWDPIEWFSESRLFSASDGYPCGEIGGGD